MEKFVDWAKDGEEPLQSYATGLLARAMEVQEIAGNFKDHNAQLVCTLYMDRLSPSFSKILAKTLKL